MLVFDSSIDDQDLSALSIQNAEHVEYHMIYKRRSSCTSTKVPCTWCAYMVHGTRYVTVHLLRHDTSMILKYTRCVFDIQYVDPIRMQGNDVNIYVTVIKLRGTIT